MERQHQQWLHGFLETCLLSLLADRRDYGRGLDERLRQAGLDAVPGGTLYPALLRLEKHGLVRVEREPSVIGPPRKYYELTEAGRQAARVRREDWRTFRQSMDQILDSQRARSRP